MRKITLALAFLAATFLISASTVHAKTYSQAVMKAPGEPTLEDAMAAFEFGQPISEPRNVTKWMDENFIPQEIRPFLFVKYKGIIYGAVYDPWWDEYYIVTFKGSGDFITEIFIQ